MGNDKDIYVMMMGVTALILLLTGFIVVFVFMYRNRQVRHRQELKAERERYDHEMLKTQLEIREQTLKNLSEEIHDNVGQVLSLAVMNLSAIDFSNISNAEIKVDNITQLVKKAVADLRNLSRALDS
jgi:two-component system, NarL family, sensor kinase